MNYFSSGTHIKPSKGDILISEPYLDDINFYRKVILICEHGKDGTIGIVLNKLAPVKLGEVLDDVKDYQADLFIGGPIEQGTLHFIHRHVPLRVPSNCIMENVYWSGDYEKLISMINTRTMPRENIRFFVGYSGWSEGQLMDELETGSWIVMKNVSSSIIFDLDNRNLWRECLKNMGGKYKLIANYPRNPRSN